MSDERTDGTDGLAQRPVALYLDTADLSYLALGKAPGLNEAATVALRDRLLLLIRDGRVRLRLSFVHAAEMALKQKVAAASVGWLRALAVERNVVWIFTTPESIFAAELAGLPAVIKERPVPPDEIEALAIRAANGGVVPASNVADWVKQIVRDAGGAERLGAKARRPRDPRAQRAHQLVVEQVLRGDLSAIPPEQLPAARAMLAQMDAVLASSGLQRSTVIEAMDRARIGLGWTVHFADARLPRRDANGWLHDDARAAPATVLRAGMQRQRDNNASRHEKDKIDIDFEYDVRHIAYAAYSDVATIDAENFDATKGARRLLERPAFHRTGKLREVLQDIEAAVAGRGEPER